MYHELLMEHYKFPTYKKEIKNPIVSSHDLNASCGDTITFDLIIENDIIVDLGFAGSGCIISQASADILAGHLHQKNIALVHQITSQDLLGMMEITLGPNRLKCALLALQILQKAIAKYQDE